jgi:hypothetical protein
MWQGALIPLLKNATAPAGSILDEQQLLQDKHHQHSQWLEWLAMVFRRELVGVMGDQGGTNHNVLQTEGACVRFVMVEWMAAAG